MDGTSSIKRIRSVLIHASIPVNQNHTGTEPNSFRSPTKCSHQRVSPNSTTSSTSLLGLRRFLLTHLMSARRTTFRGVVVPPPVRRPRCLRTAVSKYYEARTHASRSFQPWQPYLTARACRGNTILLLTPRPRSIHLPR